MPQKEIAVKKEALRARSEAFLKEFPFVHRYAKIHRFSERPTVKRMDLDLMDCYGWTAAHAMRRRRALGYARFFLIDSVGQELGEVNPYDVVRPSLSLWHPSTWFHQDVNGETVYEALRKVGADRVKFVLEVRDCWDRTQDFDPHHGLEIVLHKVPSGWRLSDWLVRIREIAGREIQEEVAKINRV